MENIERIEEMEQKFNQAFDALRKMETAFEHYESTQENIRQLNAYLGSKEWKDDLYADEAGILPVNLKRGVLSEDGIWNLLADWHELKERMAQLVCKQSPINPTK